MSWRKNRVSVEERYVQESPPDWVGDDTTTVSPWLPTFWPSPSTSGEWADWDYTNPPPPIPTLLERIERLEARVAELEKKQK